MPEQAATSSDNAATTAIRALRARRTRLSYHLRGKGCPPSPRSHIEGRKSIESKAWAKTRRILASRVFSATWGPSHAQPKTTASAAIRSAGHAFEAPRLPGGLYAVATPIGNLRDITLRALEILAAADLVACEDTRVTRKLFDHYGLSAPLIAYHDHNAEAVRPKILRAARGRRGRRPGLRCRHAADLRSGLPAGARSHRGRACGERGARRLRRR